MGEMEGDDMNQNCPESIVAETALTLLVQSKKDTEKTKKTK